MSQSLVSLGLAAYIGASCLLAIFPQSVLGFCRLELQLLVYLAPAQPVMKAVLGALVH